MKKLLISAAIFSVITFAAYTVKKAINDVTLSKLQLENIEALGNGESYNVQTLSNGESVTGGFVGIIIVGTPCYGDQPKKNCFLGVSKYSPDFIVVDGQKREELEKH